MQKDIEQLNENYKLAILNIKSIIAEKPQSTDSSSSEETTQNIYFLKSKLESLNTQYNIVKHLNNKKQQDMQASYSILKHKIMHNNEEFKLINKAQNHHQATANYIFRKQIIQDLIDQRITPLT